MLFSASALLFLFNLGLASLLCAGVTLCAGWCCRALPKRHATLVAGLIASISAIAIVGVGSLFSLGQFSAFSADSSEVLNSNIRTQELSTTHPAHELGSISEPLQVQPTSKPLFETSQNTKVRLEDEQTQSSTTDTSSVASKATGSWQSKFFKLGGFLSFVWLIGTLVFAALRTRDWFRCNRLIRSSSLNSNQDLAKKFDLVADQLQLINKPKLLVSEKIPTPVVVGVFQPVVIFPADANQLFSSQQLRSVLAHELSHVARKDHWVVGLQILATTLYWWNPLVWSISNKVAEVRELICDDIAVEAHNTPREYAQSIIAMAERVVSQKELLAPLGISNSSASELERRLRRIISNKTAALQTRLSRWSLAGVTLFATALVIGILFAQVPAGKAQALQTDNPETFATQSGDSDDLENKKDGTTDEGQMKFVRGRVVDAALNPVGGVKLWLPLAYQPRRTVQATTDEAGNFELNCPADWISPTVIGSSWTVWAYAPGHSIQSQSVWEALRGNSDEKYTIQLPPQSKTRFKVLSPNGKSLTDVLVQPQNYRTSVGYDRVPEEMLSLVSARTGKGGFVTLPAIQSKPLFIVKLEHEKFGQQTIRVDFNHDEPKREIKLRPTGAIKGKLIGENPKWTRGVKLMFTTDNQDDGKDTQGYAEAVTDAEGKFEVPMIASGGPIRTYVTLDPKLPIRPRLKDNLYLTAGETLPLDIPLVAAPLVHGKLITKSTGEPVPNAEISLGYNAYQQRTSATTDENGQYQGRVLPGAVRVQIISMAGFIQLGEPWKDPFQVPEMDEFELPTIEVVKAQTKTGQLIDSNDQPIPQARVLAVKDNRVYDGDMTDTAGKFSVRVPEGVEVDFNVRLEGRSADPAVVSKEPLILRHTADVREKEMEALKSEKTGSYVDRPGVIFRQTN